MNLKDLIIANSSINGDLVLYAKRINGKFLPTSETVLLELTEEDHGINTEIANRKCPGFSYCMEMFLIHDMMQDLDQLAEFNDIDKKVERMIYYIEYDA